MLPKSKSAIGNCYRIVSYEAVPCELEIFIVNGIEAEKFDFGDQLDLGKKPCGNEDIDEYGCVHNVFVPYTEERNIHPTLVKYHISRDQFNAICSAIQKVCNVCMCGWCV